MDMYLQVKIILGVKDQARILIDLIDWFLRHSYSFRFIYALTLRIMFMVWSYLFLFFSVVVS